MIQLRYFVFLVFLVSGFSALPVQAQQAEIVVNSDPRYDALTWMQNSAEYSLLTVQTYRAAQAQLHGGLHDRKWSADEVQIAEGGYENKSPAVILDIDETVLDNSAYNARNILLGKPYATQSWNDWCQEGQADSIPGALEFVKSAEGLGVKVFYVTNRRDIVKDATVKNLLDLGFPADDSSVFTKNAELGRGDDKVSRRAMIAKEHRIVLLIGDSMSDLCSGMDTLNSVERNRIATEKTTMLGTRWIIMPNPVYGGWQRALPSGKSALKPKQ